MERVCEQCGASYDDATCWTYCPHARFISDEDAARKDLAISLMGKRLEFAGRIGPLPTALVHVESVTATGMVTLRGWSGEFSPTLFKVVD